MITVTYENGVPVKINGKNVQKSFQNAFKKAMGTSYFVRVSTEHTFYNPFGGGGVTLSPLEGTIYNWVKAWEVRYNRAVDNGVFPVTKITEAPVTAFDNMRYFFSSINALAYMELLD
jgi:hypothetical protein